GRAPVLGRTIQIRWGVCIGRGTLMRAAATRVGKGRGGVGEDRRTVTGRGGVGAARAGGWCCLWLLPLGRACLGRGNDGAGRSPVIVPVRRRVRCPVLGRGPGSLTAGGCSVPSPAITPAVKFGVSSPSVGQYLVCQGAGVVPVRAGCWRRSAPVWAAALHVGGLADVPGRCLR